MCSELQKLSGVDYLAPGALTESASYVFGPVLKLLKAEGYREGVDLDAAVSAYDSIVSFLITFSTLLLHYHSLKPYDWRIPVGTNELNAYTTCF